MIHYTKEDIQNMDRIKRLKIINSVSGIKPANIIGSIAEDGTTNLAIFSSVMHLGSDPALLGFILRPKGDVPRHTFDNINRNNQYTINHINSSFVEKAHYTSAKFDKEISEFSRCGLNEEFVEGFEAPFVAESDFKMGMKFVHAIEIPINNTLLVIGEIEHIVFSPEVINSDHNINLELANSVGISGLNSYYSLSKIAEYPYARVTEVPKF